MTTPLPTSRTAVVTGASRGIGLEIARALVDAGLRVIMLARSRDALRAHANALGASAVPLPCDVADEREVHRAAADIRVMCSGAPDVLVNNAGRFVLATVEQTSADALRGALDVNLVAPFLLVHEFLSEMRARKSGHVITIGSVADRTTFPENGAYAASKFGVRALHEVLRAELRGSGVRATLVSPGPVDTALWDAFDPDVRPGFTPRRQMLSPEAVGAAVRYVVMQPDDVNVDELRLSHS